MVSEASLRARAAFCSPSAAITWNDLLIILKSGISFHLTLARASRAASASAAIAR